MFAAILGITLGLVVGSFLNVVILRGSRNESFFGRSYCWGCKTALSVSELIPILSFTVQRGRCRHCGTVLSLQYPLVEGGTAVLYGALAWFFFSNPAGFSAQILILYFASLAGSAAAIVVLVSDLKYKIIPNGAVAILALLGIGAVLYRSGWVVKESLPDLTAALILSLILASLWFASQGKWMGPGDAKLILATSLILGFPLSVISFLFSFWSGGIFGIILIASKRGRMGSEIPFGPFILLGGLLAYFYGSAFLKISGLGSLW